jgi:TrmH family RNA methyltransferase
MVVFNDTLSKRGHELLNAFKDPSVQLINVPDELMAKISDTESDQGLLLVIKHRQVSLPEDPNFVVILDGIKDPGNMGTILRTAAAAGVQLVIHTPGCVDVYSPKVVRSAMGAHFNIPMASMNWEAIKTFWKEQPLYLAESSRGKPIWELDFTKAVGIIIGGEAEGASAEARQAATNFAIIPMPGKSESLNAAIAAGIFIFEVVRQRNK